MSPIKRYWFPMGTPQHDTHEDLQDNPLSIRSYSPGKWTPDTDIYEISDGLLIVMDIASVNKEEIQIAVDDKILVVSGIRHELDIPDKLSAYRLEIDFGKFQKRFRIPDSIDAHNIQARYENGFLQLKLPKLKSRKIDITQE